MWAPDLRGTTSPGRQSSWWTRPKWCGGSTSPRTFACERAPTRCWRRPRSCGNRNSREVWESPEIQVPRSTLNTRGSSDYLLPSRNLHDLSADFGDTMLREFGSQDFRKGFL